MTNLNKYIKFISETKSHIIYRCPYCGDSKKLDHGHLHVSKTKPVYRCVRCGHAGHITKLLQELNAHDVVISEDILKNTETRVFSKNVKNDNLILNYNIEEYIYDYFNERLGITDLKKYNVLSYDDYVNVLNSIDEKNIMEDVIPFLSFKGNFMVIRSINDDRFRYWNYSLDKSHGDYYCVLEEFSFKEFVKHKTIVIAEGIFDIINIHHIYNNEYPHSTIYVAGKGFTMWNTLRYIRERTLCYKPNIELYADEDKTDKDYKQSLKYMYNDLKIYRNSIGKDFGEKNINRIISLKEIS